MSYPLEHIKMGTLPNAPLVTALDLGTGVHPANKSGYGRRASQVALGVVYGKKGAVCGPVYKSHQVEGQKIRIHFNHTGKGLAFRHADTLEGFEISGCRWASGNGQMQKLMGILYWFLTPPCPSLSLFNMLLIRIPPMPIFTTKTACLLCHLPPAIRSRLACLPVQAV